MRCVSPGSPATTGLHSRTALQAGRRHPGPVPLRRGSGRCAQGSSGNEHHGKIVGAKWVKADGEGAKPGGRAPCRRAPEAALRENGLPESRDHGRLTRLFFSRDGKYLVAAGNQRGCPPSTCSIYDAQSGAEAAQLASKSRAYRAEFSPEGNLLVAGGSKVVRIWGWPSKQIVEDIPTQASRRRPSPCRPTAGGWCGGTPPGMTPCSFGAAAETPSPNL